MKKLLLASATLMISSSVAFAQEERIVWGGGAPNVSAYSGIYVPAIIDALTSNRLAGYQWGGPTEGTLDNLSRVRANPTHIAVGQLDMIDGEPGITILHRDIGPECLYMVTTEVGYENFGHVLGNAWDLQVITGGMMSGSFGTWQNLAGIYPDLQDMPVVHAGGAGAILEAVKNASEPSVGFFVQRPNPNSDVFKTIADAGMTFVPVIDLDLEEDYNFFSLKVAHTGFMGLGDGEFVETACTSVALFTGVTDGLEGRDLRRLEATIDRVTNSDAAMFTPSTRDFRDMFNGISRMTGDRISQLAADARRTAAEIAEGIGN